MKNAISRLADRYPFCAWMAIPIAWGLLFELLIIVTHR